MSTATRLAGGHRLGFESLERENSLEDLRVEGELPRWLTGTLLRTGPAKFEVGDRDYRHWFDGLAMLHRFSFADGRVDYANRFLETRAYRAARDTGRIAYSEFATDPCRSLFRRVSSMFAPPAFGDNANVNITRLGDQHLAMTETPLPVVFDPQTLDTVGVGHPAPGQLTVAHPHRAPAGGELVSYATHFGPRSSYRVYAQRPGGEQRRIASLPISRPAYMHSFAITERHVVLVEFPLVVVPLALPLSGRPFIENFKWQPQRGTRFRVIELDSGRLRGSYEAEPFFCFHHVNAFERGGELVIDMSTYADAEIVRSLYLDRLRAERALLPENQLRRYRINLDSGRVAGELLSDSGVELPRIDYGRRNGRPYRYVYGVRGDESFVDTIVRIDVDSGDASSWSEPGAHPGEPVFVRDPDDDAEDGGVLLSVVLDATAQSSFLLVLDARSMHELARVRVPHHIPFGFHGQYFR